MDLNFLTMNGLLEMGTLGLLGFLGIAQFLIRKYDIDNNQSATIAYLFLIQRIIIIAVIGVILILGFQLSNNFFSKQIMINNAWMIDFVIFLIVSIFCFLTINQFTQKEGISNNQSTIQEQISLEPEKTKEEILLIDKLEQYMKEAQPYLQTKIKIADLAEDLKEKPHVLSRLINKYYGYNFFHFINHYRVKHATQLLRAAENRQYTIEGIGQHCGFNSRTTFNNRFKEMTGVSPGEFQKTGQRLVSQSFVFMPSKSNN